MGDIKHGNVETMSPWDFTRSPIYFQASLGRTIGGWTLLSFAVCGLLHIAINADPIVASLAVISMMLGMAPIIRFGVFNIGSVLVFLVAFRYVGFPLFAKLALGQALDSNLIQPLSALAAVTLGVLSYFLAFMIVNNIKVGFPLLRPVVKPHLLRRLSFIAFLVGFVANMENALRVNLQIEGWNISNSFIPFLHLAIISAAASSILKSKGHRILDGWTLTILAVEVVFAFVQNARTPILEAILALAVTDIAFRKRFAKKQIAITIAAFLLLIIITPVFLYVRNVRGDLDWRERITSTVTVFGNWREAESAFLAFRHAEALSSGFYLRYYGTPTNVFERISLINHTDVLINGADSVGLLGLEVIDRAVQHALPRLLAPDKPIGYSEGDWMHYKYMGDYRYGNFLTAPLIGVGYASFGWVGVFVFPIIIGSGIFMLIKKVVGFNIIGNIWVIYILISVNNQFVEGGTWSNIAIIMRKLPQDTIVMLIFSIIIGTNRLVLRKSAQAKESQTS